MVRPPKDAETKRGVTLTFKVTAREHALWKRLAAARRAELKHELGQNFELSVSAYIRWLADRDAAARGLDVDDEPAPAPAPAPRARARARTPRAASTGTAAPAPAPVEAPKATPKATPKAKRTQRTR